MAGGNREATGRYIEYARLWSWASTTTMGYSNQRTVMKQMIAVLAFSMAVGVAAAATYEETFTPKANKAYSEDINVWVYTSEFAERFGMPKEWVDDELEGAYAVAFRVEHVSRRLMLPHKGPDASMTSRDCIIDMYVPSSTSIPWVDDEQMGRKYYTPDSPQYLRPQSAEDISWHRRPIGIESPGKKARRPVTRLDGGTLFMREYDRRIYPEVAYMSFNMGCMEPPKRAVLVEFCVDEPWEGRRCHASHEVHVPDKFMKKLHGQWYDKTGRDAAKRWREAIGR
ncbi:MAG: hypothetical protein K8I04_10160 [Gammaproteobacteria bacterium]|nr:hypothetical protein [Gammaproteobacteria bacterium]